MTTMAAMDNKHPLAEWRQARGLTQDDFARLCSVTRWTINSIETGRRAPSMDLAKKIIAKTQGGVTAEQIMPAMARFAALTRATA